MCDQKGNECEVAHDDLESQYSQLILILPFLPSVLKYISQYN